MASCQITTQPQYQLTLTGEEARYLRNVLGPIDEDQVSDIVGKRDNLDQAYKTIVDTYQALNNALDKAIP